MALQDKLDVLHREIIAEVPEMAAKFDADTEDLIRKGIGSNSLKVNDTAPDFELPDQHYRTVRSVDLREKGPLVVAFYRGNWCPYCNLELNALQQYRPRITELGASLVAISPQLPDVSAATAETHGLSFPVLSDVGNVLARKFGLVFVLSEHLRPLYAEFGIDIPKSNGDDTFELPIAGTFVIDRSGKIIAAFADIDYKKRMEPSQIVEVLTELQK